MVLLQERVMSPWVAESRLKRVAVWEWKIFCSLDEATVNISSEFEQELTEERKSMKRVCWARIKARERNNNGR